MEKVQELEWAEAQKIAISEDLVAAAKQQLQFLAEVDRHRQLYDGSALNRAIHRLYALYQLLKFVYVMGFFYHVQQYLFVNNKSNARYKYCWLPLLAKQAKSQVSEGPLVVPLDCEWVWHCHKLNPVGPWIIYCEMHFSVNMDRDSEIKFWNNCLGALQK